jgi:SAM-dependent methyltransferase
MGTKWDKKRSEWYCRAIEQSNYSKNTIAAIAPLLRQCESVLDVGAGCGALSLPLAKRVKKVTAIEPSKWMYGLLRQRAGNAGVRNIRAYNVVWKVTRRQGGMNMALIRSHDMVLCANLPHTLVCSARFLREITAISKKYIVYIQNAGGWNRFYYRELYPLLLKEKYINECDYIHTYNFLHKHGILANVKIFEYSLDQPFEDFHEALSFWKHRLNIRLTPEKETLLVRFLRKKLVTSGKTGRLSAPFGTRKSAVTWWTP